MSVGSIGPFFNQTTEFYNFYQPTSPPLGCRLIDAATTVALFIGENTLFKGFFKTAVISGLTYATFNWVKYQYCLFENQSIIQKKKYLNSVSTTSQAGFSIGIVEVGGLMAQGRAISAKNLAEQKYNDFSKQLKDLKNQQQQNPRQTSITVGTRRETKTRNANMLKHNQHCDALDQQIAQAKLHENQAKQEYENLLSRIKKIELFKLGLHIANLGRAIYFSQDELEQERNKNLEKINSVLSNYLLKVTPIDGNIDSIPTFEIKKKLDIIEKKFFIDLAQEKANDIHSIKNILISYLALFSDQTKDKQTPEQQLKLAKNTKLYCQDFMGELFKTKLPGALNFVMAWTYLRTLKAQDSFMKSIDATRIKNELESQFLNHESSLNDLETICNKTLSSSMLETVSLMVDLVRRVADIKVSLSTLQKVFLSIQGSILNELKDN